MSATETGMRVIETLNAHYEEKRAQGFRDGWKSRDAEVIVLREEIKKLTPVYTWPSIDWSYMYPAIFGGNTNVSGTASGAVHSLPKAANGESLGQKIDRLIRYFEKRAKENTKRAEELENKVRTTFNGVYDYVQLDRSSYYLSGKADSYERAAQKVREILG